MVLYSFLPQWPRCGTLLLTVKLFPTGAGRFKLMLTAQRFRINNPFPAIDQGRSCRFVGVAERL